MVILKENELSIIRLSPSTRYLLDSGGLHLWCLRTDKKLTIVGVRYTLSLLINSLLVGSSIDSIKKILKIIDINYYKMLEDGGFLE